jgi:hypothetical protein
VNYTYRFLEFLLAGEASTSPRRNPYTSQQISEVDSQPRFSLLGHINEVLPSDDDIERYLDRQSNLAELHQEMIEIARLDGLDVREAAAFIDEWVCFVRNWGDLILYVPDFLHPQHMMFWAALKRGWAHWRPSENCRNQVRNALLARTRIQHRFQADGHIRPRFFARQGVQRLIASSGLPEAEINRLDPSFYPTDTSPERMATLFVNWNSIAGLVGERQLPREASFTIHQLRIDRLERLIREECLINEGRTTGGFEIDIENDDLSHAHRAIGVEVDDLFANTDEDGEEIGS